jgi:hypothetical protein
MIRGQATCGETRKKEEQWQASDEDPRESSFDRCALCRVAWVPREMLGLPAPICIEVLPKGIVGNCGKGMDGMHSPETKLSDCRKPRQWAGRELAISLPTSTTLS